MTLSDTFLSELIRGARPIYCAAPLFSPIGRLGALNLADAVESEIHAYLELQGLASPSSRYVFLPFRDTRQDQILGPHRALQIYEMDLEQLRTSAAILARIDGLAKDSGVSMEIGFAYGIGIPVGVLRTDFMWEGASEGDAEWQTDPIIASLSTVTLTEFRLAMQDNEYRAANWNLENHAVKEFARTCLHAFPSHASRFSFEPESSTSGGVYIDVMGGRFGWSRDQQAQIVTGLEHLEIPLSIAHRYHPMHLDSADRVLAAARVDLANAMSCRVAVFSGDSPEMDQGSAALLGVCKALGKFVVFQYSSPVLYKGDGGQRMRVNLMVELAADVVTASTQETVDIVTHWALVGKQ